MTTNDSYENFVTGLGAEKDKSQYITISHKKKIKHEDLARIFDTDGIGRRIIRALVADAMREWIEIPADTDGEFMNYLEAKKIRKHIFDAACRARCFGGSIIIMGIDDAGDLETPVRETAIWGIDWMRVIDKRFIEIKQTDKDPASERYGLPLVFTIKKKIGDPDGYPVHYSRCVIFHGDESYSESDFWGQSIIDPINHALSNTSMVFNIVSLLCQEWKQDKYKIAGLRDLLEAGKYGDVKKRIDLIQYSKSAIRAVILDADLEDISTDAIGAGSSGIPELMERMMMYLSAVTGYPITKLWGRSAIGMNATGEEDIKNYYDEVSAYQENHLFDAITRILQICKLAKDAPKIERVDFRFSPLWQQSEEEIVKMRKTQSEIDKAYYEMGVLTADEIRKSRFEGEYKLDTELDGDSIA